MAKTVNNINLLPDKSEGLITQFLTWALSVGRLLIILTETLALATFLYRFGLDMQLVDLHDQINSDSFILKNFQSSEANFRDLQTRLALAKKYDTISSSIPTVLKDVVTMGEGKVTFDTILVSQTGANLAVRAANAASIANFVEALKNYPAFANVSVDKVQDQTSTAQVTVAITAKLKNDDTGSNVNLTP